METKVVRTTNAVGKISLIFIALSVFLSACRKEDDIPTDIPVIDEDITIATTLENHLSGVDYIIDGCINVDGVLLTVNPGVTVQFKSGSCLTMTDGGSLKAIGSDTTMISFEGMQASKGYWEGVYYYNSNSTNNIMQYVTVRDAGGNSTNYRNAAINIGSIPTMGENSSRVRMNNVTVSNSQGYGIYISGKAILDEFEGNTITNCTKAPVQLMASNAGVLNNNNTYTGNGNDYIEINGTMVQNSTSAADFTINKLSVPYAVFGDMVIEHNIGVQAGTQFVMQAGSSIFSNEQGTFTATGTNSQRISFAGAESTKGYWDGFVAQYDATLILNYCDISDGGNASNGLSIPVATINAVGLGSNTLTVRNCSISNGLNNGIAVNDPQVTYNVDIQTSNTFSGIDGDNFRVY